MRVPRSSFACLLAIACASHTSTKPTDAPTDPEPIAAPPAASDGAPTPASTVAWPTAEARPPTLSRKALEPGRPKGDGSRAFPAWETSYVSVAVPEDPAEGELHGKVTALRPGTMPAPDAVSFEPTGSLVITAADGRTVSLGLSGSGMLAVAIGDEVMVKWRTQQLGIHTVSDIGLVDRAHRVIYASSGSGDVTFAPGWYTEAKGVADRGSPHMRGGARRESRWLVVARGDAAAVVQQSEGSRRLVTDDGEYAVSGSAVTWSAGKRPLDSSAYETFGLVRLAPGK
jgi:hypothetical protein